MMASLIIKRKFFHFQRALRRPFSLMLLNDSFRKELRKEDSVRSIQMKRAMIRISESWLFIFGKT